ncbi:hypothetical protein [Bombilactobacillus thymidiniphilus]|uniref:Uncharacterized protein n=1 Tax=Bombilactobacillus thymidiniphilus TaxID=2923363 RepID=A0ABY4PBI7_9LACO|nr:hypothetical protein [Bombilactobacillus thymidiniphilus]UQS83051.1 hypothetical protein MOO47_04505 [Bombilactobacillus thymidiniphilus]
MKFFTKRYYLMAFLAALVGLAINFCQYKLGCQGIIYWSPFVWLFMVIFYKVGIWLAATKLNGKYISRAAQSDVSLLTYCARMPLHQTLAITVWVDVIWPIVFFSSFILLYGRLQGSTFWIIMYYFFVFLYELLTIISYVVAGQACIAAYRPSKFDKYWEDQHE